MRSTKRQSLAIASTGLMLALAGIAQAQPTYSSISSPASGEPGQTSIFGTMYGGTWTRIGTTNDFTNGSLTAFRVADGGGTSPLTLGASFTSNLTDQIFAGTTATITMHSKNAGDNSIFGWYDDTLLSPVFQPIINTGTLHSPLTVGLSNLVRFALSDTTTGSIFTSRNSDNHTVSSSSSNQLVSYSISGLSDSSRTWVLFWEDRINGQGADYDYNDAVVSISAAAPLAPVPTPGSAVAALVGMGLMLKRRKR